MRRVVVTGMGMVSPIGLNVSESWNAILEGQTGVTNLESVGIADLPTKIGGLIPNFIAEERVAYSKDAMRSGRFVQLAVAASQEALKDAGLFEQPLGMRAGVNIGVALGGLSELQKGVEVLNAKSYRRVSPLIIPSVIPNMASGIVSSQFGLEGPNTCTSTACASGTHAIGESYLYIKSGMCDVMVCGGSEAAFSKIGITGFSNIKALSRRNEDPKKASRPFDKQRDGFVMGEGSGVLVLEEYESAIKRGAAIYAELIGFGMNADAHHITKPSPEGVGASRCMEMALSQGGIMGDKVDYVNAHGTSTHFNDLFESMAINRSLGQKALVSSTKGSTGHCLGGAGGVEAVFTVLSMKNSVAPHTVNLEDPLSEVDLHFVQKQPEEKVITYALSNSFGFGGTNACLLFKSLD